MGSTDLVVTNFNRNFTGVSATAAAVVRHQKSIYQMALAGHPLPGCPLPVSRREALALARQGPGVRPFQIWHVRRDPEMQWALFARDMLRLPIRIVFTSAAQRRHSAWPRWLISRMDAVIATTEDAARYVPNTTAVVPHGVDVDIFCPADDRAAAWARLGLGGARAIACIGRIRPEKGTDLFIDTALRVLPQFPDLTALVVGRAKAEHRGFLADLKDRVRKAGMEERIRFVGEVPAKEMPALVRALSLLVALPRYEGYGMTPLEAMASGVPVIASDTGHFREFLGDGAGIIVPSEDSLAAAEPVSRLLRNSDLHHAMARTAMHRARTQFGIAREVAGIAAVYERLWSGDAGSDSS